MKSTSKASPTIIYQEWPIHVRRDGNPPAYMACLCHCPSHDYLGVGGDKASCNLVLWSLLNSSCYYILLYIIKWHCIYVNILSSELYCLIFYDWSLVHLIWFNSLRLIGNLCILSPIKLGNYRTQHFLRKVFPHFVKTKKKSLRVA